MFSFLSKMRAVPLPLRPSHASASEQAAFSSEEKSATLQHAVLDFASLAGQGVENGRIEPVASERLILIKQYLARSAASLYYETLPSGVESCLSEKAVCGWASNASARI